jgi:hypothetical protein
MSATPVPTMRGHYWRVHLPEPWQPVNSDDLTLDEVERLETITDVAWAIANPLASLRQAKGWLMVAAMHAGATEAEATGLVQGPDALTLGGIKAAFQLHETPVGQRKLALVDNEVPPVPPSSAPTSAIG